MPFSGERRSLRAEALLAPPPNDTCSGALVISDGPYPVLSPVTTGVDMATGSGDPSNTCSPTPVENGVWYRWTPSIGGSYFISSCSGATATTDGDGVLALFTSTSGCGGGFTQVAGACNDDACHPLGPSTINAFNLVGGTTYFILASHYPTASGGGPTISQYQVRIDRLAVSNDTCGGAEVIPSTLAVPYLSTIADSTNSTGDPILPAPSCASGLTRGIWYVFTPAVTANYLLSTCQGDHGGTATGNIGTIVSVYTSLRGCEGPFSELPTSGFTDGCDAGSCGVGSGIGGGHGFITTKLTAGTTYYVVLYTNGNGAVQLRAQGPPVNDLCQNAAPLPLDVPVAGTTGAASDDSHSPSATLCYAGVGQTPILGTGRDVVYSFTAPEAGRYSFRVNGYVTGDGAVYVGDCDTRPGPVPVSCVGGANRKGNNLAPEEASCLFLHSGQQVWVYVDDANSPTGGGSFSIEARRCPLEIEPNNTPATANPIECGMQGSLSPAGDADFLSLGVWPAGSRAFVAIDLLAANIVSNNFFGRITDSANTLEYEALGTVGGALAGTPLPGGEAFVKVSANAPAEPYRIFSVVQPPLASATPEVEPNNTIATANSAAGGYISGNLDAVNVDLFGFTACSNDLVFLALDLDPLRNNTGTTGGLGLYDASGTVLIPPTSRGSSQASTTPGVGLNAVTPFSSGLIDFQRVVASGTYYAVVGNGSPAGDYLLSISKNCKRESDLLVDLSVDQADAPDPVNPGSDVVYTLTVTNTGPADAQEVKIIDPTPGHTTFVSAAPPAGWTCAAPAVGTAGTITCSTPSMATGSAIVTIVLKVDANTAGGTSITNTATAGTCRVDSNAANNIGSTTTTVTTAQLLPSAADDCLDTQVHARVTLLPSSHPGGCTETLTLQGPSKIWRSNASDPGDGRDVIQTLLACARWAGTSNAGGCNLGDVLLHPRATAASTGQIRSVTSADPYPADSYLDVYSTVETGAGPLHTTDFQRLSGTVNTVPPESGQSLAGPGTSIALFDEGDVQVGTLEFLDGQVLDSISCPCACEPVITASSPQAWNVSIPLSGTGVQYDLVKGAVGDSAPDWVGSFAATSCIASNSGSSVPEGSHALAGQLLWYVARDGAFNQVNGTYNACPAKNQAGNRDAETASACP